MPGIVSYGRCTEAGALAPTVLENLTLKLRKASLAAAKFRPRGAFGVILASTKGVSEDFIRKPGADLAIDPLTPLLQNALRRMELQPSRSLCISNACSSGLAAVKLAQIWLRQGLDDVLILAADASTPFVRDGFASLKLGFAIGEAACVMWVSARPSDLRVRGVGLDSDGSTVTRPLTAVPSLRRAILQIPDVLSRPPDLIFAHGTGTPANEETEGLVFDELFPQVPRLSSKKEFGHTLGASANLDMILACEKIREGSAKKILLSSLGFGGMHAAALVEAT